MQVLVKEESQETVPPLGSLLKRQARIKDTIVLVCGRASEHKRPIDLHQPQRSGHVGSQTDRARDRSTRCNPFFGRGSSRCRSLKAWIQVFYRWTCAYAAI